MIEKKICVESFDKSVATSLFGMVAVDAKNLFQGIRRGANYNASERVFYERLSEQLIDNTYDTRNLRARRPEAKVLQEQVASLTNTVPSSEHVIGTTPTKRRKKNHPTFLLQGRCCICSMPSTHVCRECQSNYGPHHKHQEWICDEENKICMGKHILSTHPDIVPAPNAHRPINFGHAI